ncbi:MAG: hypothetical protein GXO12_03125, partial [Epsilonproteobacteria bacterium]|nr:hypothetical protein [Campylobacterota bacterium]
MTKKESTFLRYIILIPFISTLFFLLLTVWINTYLNIKDGESIVKEIEANMISDKKSVIKDRVNFVLECIKNKQKRLKKKIQKGSYDKKAVQKLTNETKNDIIKTINNFMFDNHGYVFIYKILNMQGGKRFAVMIANPNTPHLIGKYLDSGFKDAKGFKFREEFLRKINKYGEAFVKYYYKKPDGNKISLKISYFK